MALPMSLMTLALLSSLTIAFASLGRLEPTIASNHLRSTQAQALADSGIERAVWALTHADAPGGFGGTGQPPNVTVAAVAPPAYDGTTFIPVGAIGGFAITVLGTDPNLRVTRAVGWTPTSDPDDVRTKARAEVVATLVRVRNLAREVTCALCVGSAVSLTASVVDPRGSGATDCGAKAAVAATGAITHDADTTIFGATQSDQSFGFLLSADDLDTLRALAIQRGTYIRPASDAQLEPTGIAHGLVFVDTPAGTSALDPINVANVAVGPAFTASLPFRGWLVVLGNVTLTAGADLDGLLYAANAVRMEGPADIAGVVVARQALAASSLDLAGLSIRFDCAAARATAYLPQGWFIRAGSYCDGTAGC